MARNGPSNPQDGARPLTLWRLSDGKPGHDKQSLGLATALGRLVRTELHDIRLPRAGTGLGAWLTGRFAPGRDLPAPRLILGAGHATHLPMLAARRAYGGRLVVLMKPSLPLTLFDLCLIPLHDRPPPRGNVIPTRGGLNTVVPGNAQDPGRGLMLVGGPSPHYRWDTQRVAGQIREIVAAEPAIRWTLSTSRRTPADLPAGLEGLPGLTLLTHEQTPAGWLEAELARCGQVWVTPDSVSMVHEALTAGCRTGLLELDADPASRVARGVGDLLKDGYATSLADWRNGRPLAAPPHPLDESGRCARLILERWF